MNWEVFPCVIFLCLICSLFLFSSFFLPPFILIEHLLQSILSPVLAYQPYLCPFILEAILGLMVYIVICSYHSSPVIIIIQLHVLYSKKNLWTVYFYFPSANICAFVFFIVDPHFHLASSSFSLKIYLLYFLYCRYPGSLVMNSFRFYMSKMAFIPPPFLKDFFSG